MQVSAGRPVSDWAVLIYSSASADLVGPAQAALEEVAGAPRQDGVVIGAQLGKPGVVERFALDTPSAPLARPESLGALDMSEPKQLTRFLEWGMQRFPARHYAVVIGGHSGGILGAVTDSERTRMMRLDDMRRALERSGCRPDLLIFNSCLMAQAEVAREFSNQAGWLVASQTEEKGLGMPLGAWVSGLHPGQEPSQVARDLARVCAQAGERSPQVAAADLGQTGRLTQGLDELGQCILEHPEAYSQLRQAIEAAPAHWPRPWDRPLSDLKDLRTVLGKWSENSQLPADLRERSQAALGALGAVTADSLSAFLPARSLSDLGPGEDRVWALYDRLTLSDETTWDEAMGALAARSQ